MQQLQDIKPFGLYTNTLKEAIENLLFSLKVSNEPVNIEIISNNEVEFFYPVIEKSTVKISLPNEYVSNISVEGFGLACTLIALKKRLSFLKVNSLKQHYVKLYLYAANHAEAHEIGTIIENVNRELI